MTVSSRGNIEDVHAVTPMQAGMIFADRLASDGERPYVQQVTWAMPASVDLNILRRAWESAAARVPVLRSFVVWAGRPEPVQVVCRSVRLPWRDHDGRSLSARDFDGAFDDLLARDRAEGIALDRAPLMRLTAAHRGDGSVRMIWTFHHVLLDGWSLSLVFDEVLAAYAALADGGALRAAPAPPRYRGYAAWLAGRDREADRAYWTGLLAGLDLPTAVPGRGLHGAAVGRRLAVRRLSPGASADLRALCAAQRATLGSALQLAWAVLLGAYARDSDVVFGLTLAGRPPELADAERTVGLFINTVPVRVRLDAGLSPAELLRRVSAQGADREGREHAALADIKAALGLRGEAPLFDSAVVIENYPIGRAMAERGAALGVTELAAHEAAGLALTLIVEPGDAIDLKLLFDGRRLGAGEAERVLDTLMTILDGIAADPDRRLAALPLAGAEERRAVAAFGRGPARDWGPVALLHGLVARQAARTPDAEAVRCEGASLTYRDLDRRAGRLAERLSRAGVGCDRLVGVFMERSPELVVALLAVLKAGGALLPIDAETPSARVAALLGDAQAPVVLIHGPTARRSLPGPWTTLRVDAAEGAGAAGAALAAEVAVGPDDLAYCLYTSGSTGAPKGALNSHRAICNRLLWMQEAYPLLADDRVLQKTPLSFDVCIWEFFWPLISGATLVLARPGGHRDPAYLAALIRAEAVTTLHFVPSMLRLFLEQPDLRSSCRSLRRTICSGEALPADLVELFAARAVGDLHNLYGPAEAAIDVTAWACAPGEHADAVPIGRPIANCDIFLLDPNGRLVPRGMAGELHIGGTAVGRGYHRRPDLTAERFLSVPVDGVLRRLYRTGDLARWRDDGALEFLGRCDDQIKLNGVRIEPGEVEAALCAFPGVAAAAAVAVEAAAGQRQLVGYYTVSPGAEVDRSGLLDSLRGRLPAAMVPARLDRLDRWPLSANGKLDRRALAARPAPAAAGAPPAAPRSAMERKVAAAWCAVLEVEAVGLRDNFFELGGTSLLAVPLHARLRDSCDPGLTVTELFRYPTVETLAARLVRGAAPPDPVPHPGPSPADRRSALRGLRQGARDGASGRP